MTGMQLAGMAKQRCIISMRQFARLAGPQKESLLWKAGRLGPWRAELTGQRGPGAWGSRAGGQPSDSAA
ncbi:Arylsulfatase G, partial [Frankliniella fusca]